MFAIMTGLWAVLPDCFKPVLTRIRDCTGFAPVMASVNGESFLDAGRTVTEALGGYSFPLHRQSEISSLLHMSSFSGVSESSGHAQGWPLLSEKLSCASNLHTPLTLMAGLEG